jgi:hypothetical protein
MDVENAPSDRRRSDYLFGDRRRSREPSDE